MLNFSHVENIFITLVSIVLIISAFFLFLISLFLELTIANTTGAIIFVLSGVAAMTGSRTGNWNWIKIASLSLIIGWVVIYTANINTL